MDKETPRFKNHCGHPPESFIGRAGEYDVYIEKREWPEIFRGCLRYGDKPEEYLSGGAGSYQDCVWIVKRIMEQFNDKK